jgi:hypothetical protein
MGHTLTPHPVASLFPEMPAADFVALVADIRQNGVKVPILVHRGKILDGRHRYRACLELGIACPVVQWDGEDAWLEAQSRNMLRRHLAKDQIYAIRKLAAERFPELDAPLKAAKEEAKQRQIRKSRRGRKSAAAVNEPSASRPSGRKESADVIGAQLGVSGATVKRVDRLAREAPELVLKVAAGEMSVIRALREVAVKRHSDFASSESASEPFSIDPGLRRVRQVLETEWGRCPSEFHLRFLYGVQAVFRELVAEHKAAYSPRLATGTEHATVGR